MKNKTLLIGIAGIILVIFVIFFAQTHNKEKEMPLFELENSKEMSLFELENSKEFDNKSLEDVKKEYESNYSILQKIPRKFYMMPEFYPNFDRNNIIKGILGYGAHPGEVSYNATDFKTGQYLDIYTLVLSSYGVYTYQGLGLVLQSSDDDLFKTTVEPSEILLYPLNLTDPMSTNWVYKIKMRITAKKDIPDGRYAFKLRAKTPSAEKSNEFASKINSTDIYQNGAMIQTENFFDFILYAYNR